MPQLLQFSHIRTLVIKLIDPVLNLLRAAGSLFSGVNCATKLALRQGWKRQAANDCSG
ncbi:MAG: Uncharacterised protein [Hyphomonas sp. TMED17]|nr:MAG: Uncharacterised protein [Hyphomonas sp. TMED17]